jgi:DNA-binding XRE family transcriptional regulator
MRAALAALRPATKRPDDFITRENHASLWKKRPRPESCSVCGKTEGFMVWHHPSYEPGQEQNVVALCGGCHRRVHGPAPVCGHIWDKRWRVGKLITDARINLHYTQAELSQKVGCRPELISLIEVGKKCEDVTIMNAILAILRIAPEDSVLWWREFPECVRFSFEVSP